MAMEIPAAGRKAPGIWVCCRFSIPSPDLFASPRFGGRAFNYATPARSLQESRLFLEWPLSHHHPRRVSLGIDNFAVRSDIARPKQAEEVATIIDACPAGLGSRQPDGRGEVYRGARGTMLVVSPVEP